MSTAFSLPTKFIIRYQYCKCCLKLPCIVIKYFKFKYPINNCFYYCLFFTAILKNMFSDFPYLDGFADACNETDKEQPSIMILFDASGWGSVLTLLSIGLFNIEFSYLG